MPRRRSGLARFFDPYDTAAFKSQRNTKRPLSGTSKVSDRWPVQMHCQLTSCKTASAPAHVSDESQAQGSKVQEDDDDQDDEEEQDTQHVESGESEDGSDGSGESDESEGSEEPEDQDGEPEASGSDAETNSSSDDDDEPVEGHTAGTKDRSIPRSPPPRGPQLRPQVPPQFSQHFPQAAPGRHYPQTSQQMPFRPPPPESVYFPSGVSEASTVVGDSSPPRTEFSFDGGVQAQSWIQLANGLFAEFTKKTWLSNKVIKTGNALREELESQSQTREVWESLDFKEEQDKQTADRLTAEATAARETGGFCYMMNRYMKLPDQSRWTSGLPGLPDDVTCMALGTLEIDRHCRIDDRTVIEGARKEIRDRRSAPDFERNRLVVSRLPMIRSILDETGFKMPPVPGPDGTFMLTDHRRWDIDTLEGQKTFCRYFPYMDLHLDAHRSMFMADESIAAPSGLYQETIDWFAKAHPHDSVPPQSSQYGARAQNPNEARSSTGDRDRRSSRSAPESADYFNPRHYTAPGSSKDPRNRYQPDQ